jgi:single-strand DNA-binding protein
MTGLNKVMLIGRVGREPDVYQFDDGTKKISFSLATTESYRDKSSNDWKEITEWHNVVGYRYLAERNIAKGDLLYIEGKIKSRKYNDRDGNERYITEIIADKINMVLRYQPGQSNGPAPSDHTTESTAVQSESHEDNDSTQDADDLPF